MTATAFRVLVVDDDPDMAAFLARLLMCEGMAAETVGDAEAAFASVAALPPDMILLDVMLPGADGFTLCERLKSAQASAMIPIVLVTALEDQESRVRGIRAGADDFLSKPVRREELIARVKTLRRLHETRRELEARRLSAEIQHKETLRKAFARYVSPRLAETIIADLAEDGTPFRREAQRVSVVALFADLRGFTRLTESTQVHEVVGMLNEYFHVITDAAYRHEGTIFGIAGDSLLVGFNVPFAQADDLVDLRALGQAREAAQVGEQRDQAHPVRAVPERRALVLRVGDDAVGEPGRDVAGESAAQRLLALHLGGEPPRLELAARRVQPVQRFHARHQLLAVHRLGQEVVGAGADAAHPALVILERGDEHDRDHRRRRVGLEPLADLETVGARHHDVEQHQVGRRRQHIDHRRVAAVHGLGGHSLALEQAGEVRRHVGIVVDDQHAERRGRGRREARGRDDLTHRRSGPCRENRRTWRWSIRAGRDRRCARRPRCACRSPRPARSRRNCRRLSCGGRAGAAARNPPRRARRAGRPLPSSGCS